MAAGSEVQKSLPPLLPLMRLAFGSYVKVYDLQMITFKNSTLLKSLSKVAILFIS